MPGMMPASGDFSTAGHDSSDPILTKAQIILQQVGQGKANLHHISDTDRVAAFRVLVEHGHIDSLVPLLPLLYTHEQAPYSLDHHFAFEPLFRTRMPKQTCIMAARQTSKSTSLASSSVTLAAVIPNFKQLFVTPLFEQVRRLSSNYVRAFIDQSPIKNTLIDKSSDRNVMQRTFRNQSRLQFSFASLTADRARGVNTDRCLYDEVQDIDASFFSIINESMSHSDWELHSYSGTPKTPENTLSGIWEGSSKAEWFIPCYSCGKWNIPSSEHDLEKMMGEWREDISISKPGLICARCQRPVFAHQGHWEHRNPEERWQRAGYHVGQPIMWIHYTRPEKWAQLLAKRSGYGGFTPTKFANEVLGEPCGSGAQLIGRSEIQRACTLPWKNNIGKIGDEVLDRLPQYQYRVLGIDWGGGGRQTTRGGDPISLTTLALLGYLNDGTIHCLWGTRLYTPFDHIREAQQILQYFGQYRCHLLAHDYTGAGALRETFLKQSGIPQRKIIPFSYVRAASSNIINFKPASEFHPRNHYSLDKPRSLLTTISAIKLMSLRFFQWDFKTREEPGLVEDFLALIEEKSSNKLAGDTYLIGKHPQLSDDFAHAVNIGCCAIWNLTGNWPQINDELYRLSEHQVNMADITEENGGWDGEYQDNGYEPYD